MFAAGLAFALVAASSVAAQLQINTPTLPVFCQPTLLTWSGGQAPYYVTVNAGGSTTNVLENLLSATSQTSYTWTVDIAGGTSITLAIRDSTGNLNYASEVTVSPNPNGETTCAAASTAAQSSAASVASSATASLSTGSTAVIPTAAPTSISASSVAAVSSISSVSASVSSVGSSAMSSASSSRASSSVASSGTGGIVASATSAVGGAASSLTGGAAGAASSLTGAAASATGAPSAGFMTKSASLATFGLVAAGAVAMLA